MKIKFTSVLLLAGLFLFGTQAFAQKKNVSITYEIEFIADESNAAQLAMLDGSTLNLAFMKQKVSLDMAMGSLMSLNMFMDGEKGEGLMITSMMGQVTAATISAEEYKELEKEASKESQEIEELPGEKKILGYKCKRAKIKSGDNTAVMVWYTDKIKPENLNSEMTSMYKNLDGFPLEMEIMNGEMPMVMTAKSVKEAKESDFNLEIPAGANVMTFTELKNAGGGM